ncbi:hypothetical protein MSC49_15100 [Methylosinus sp. C49]|uniref:hypothetical protein n=1 Tax=Methylosinus sp. C49 TaxID=2699395 RepID=UPI001366F3FE|nr:hypothetical protein [Methylosinus sp. C49]BBU61575.1 hypothetical protein MSC49_15100 [Methylosinus sp. C49]
MPQAMAQRAYSLPADPLSLVEALSRLREQGWSHELQLAVLAAGDPEFAYRLAHEAPEAELESLEAIILRSNDLRIVFDFAVVKGERGGDVSRLEDAIVESGDGGLMVLFAADVEGADIDRIEAALRALPDAKFLRHLELELHQREWNR